MEKFIPLNQTGAPKVIKRNKSGRTGGRNKQETLHPIVINRAAENNVHILQLYYAALIQCHSSDIENRNRDTSYLHCT